MNANNFVSSEIAKLLPYIGYPNRPTTYFDLLKWLRDTHNQHLFIWYSHNNYFRVDLQEINCAYEANSKNLSKNFKTYEEALEAGVLEIINNIKSDYDY